MSGPLDLSDWTTLELMGADGNVFYVGSLAAGESIREHFDQPLQLLSSFRLHAGRGPVRPEATFAGALAKALDWTEGRLSHINEFMGAEASPEQRPQTLAACAAADSASAQAWAAIAQALREPPR